MNTDPKGRNPNSTWKVKVPRTTLERAGHMNCASCMVHAYVLSHEMLSVWPTTPLVPRGHSVSEGLPEQMRDCGDGVTLPTHQIVQGFSRVRAANTSGNTSASLPRRPVLPHSILEIHAQRTQVDLACRGAPGGMRQTGIK